MNYKGIDLNKSVIYRIVLMGLIVALTIVCFYGCGEEKEKSHTKKNTKAHTKMYGLTIGFEKTLVKNVMICIHQVYKSINKKRIYDFEINIQEMTVDIKYVQIYM